MFPSAMAISPLPTQQFGVSAFPSAMAISRMLFKAFGFWGLGFGLRLGKVNWFPNGRGILGGRDDFRYQSGERDQKLFDLELLNPKP